MVLYPSEKNGGGIELLSSRVELPYELRWSASSGFTEASLSKDATQFK